MTRTNGPGRYQAGIVLFSLFLVVVVGCGSPRDAMPPLYPAKGTVTYKGAGPVVGGAVQFAPVADTSYIVSGDIGADGSFTLATVKGSDRAAGAPEGEYRVTVMPPIPADHRAVPAIRLPQTYRVKSESNVFTIEVPPPATRP